MLILSGLQRAVSLDVACRLKQRSFVWAHASYGGRLLSLFCDPSASGAGVADLDEGDQDAASEEGEFYSQTESAQLMAWLLLTLMRQVDISFSLVR